mgnify:CR=1 FL=1
MTTRSRRLAKAERLREWADKRQHDAAALLARDAHYRGDHAFNTQPGHIPERARLIAREDQAYRSLDKADSMASRAAGIEAQADRAIYSDDEDATERLQERISGLEAERERIKSYNASCRKGKPNGDLLDEKQRGEILSIARYTPYNCKGGAFPAYHLSNLSGNIKRQRDRLVEVERREKRAQAAEDNGGVLVAGSSGFINITFSAAGRKSS